MVLQDFKGQRLQLLRHVSPRRVVWLRQIPLAAECTAFYFLNNENIMKNVNAQPDTCWGSALGLIAQRSQSIIALIPYTLQGVPW